MEVGDVIQFYDSDRQFPAWGFGGNIAGGRSGSVSHCFNLNGIPNECEVWGIKIEKSIIYYLIYLFIYSEMTLILKVTGLEGIMAAYSTALSNVRLSGPTLFGPVIDTAANIASRSLSSNHSNKYFVLLIITVQIHTCIHIYIYSFLLLCWC